MSNRLDLTGQYLGTVLIPRLNRAEEMYDQGEGWRALELLMDVIRVLDIKGVRKPDIKKALPEKKKAWLATPAQISAMASTFKGVDSTSTYAKRQRVKNRLGGFYYNKFSLEIWEILNEVGYFKMGHSGLDLDELDLAKDEPGTIDKIPDSDNWDRDRDDE